MAKKAKVTKGTRDSLECPTGFPPEKWERKTESEKAAWWWAFTQSQKLTKRGEK